MRLWKMFGVEEHPPVRLWASGSEESPNGIAIQRHGNYAYGVRRQGHPYRTGQRVKKVALDLGRYSIFVWRTV